MDEDAPHQMRWPRVVARVAGYAILAAILYVLSVGPAFYLFNVRSPTTERMLQEFYRPLFWTVWRTDFKDTMISYLAWWTYLPGGP